MVHRVEFKALGKALCRVLMFVLVEEPKPHGSPVVWERFHTCSRSLLEPISQFTPFLLVDQREAKSDPKCWDRSVSLQDFAEERLSQFGFLFVQCTEGQGAFESDLRRILLELLETHFVPSNGFDRIDSEYEVGHV